MTEETTARRRPCVLVVDDNPVIRMGLRSLLEAQGEVEVVGEASNGREAVQLAERCQPDVILLDVRMPLLNGIDAAAALARRARVLMLTYADTAETVRQAMRAGACGYLVYGHFQPDELVRAVVGTAAGGSFLSPGPAAVVVDDFRAPVGDPSAPAPVGAGLSAREREVMSLIASGHSNSEIAATLYLSAKTVKNHVNRIYAKLGARNRGHAIATWLGLAAPQR